MVPRAEDVVKKLIAVFAAAVCLMTISRALTGQTAADGPRFDGTRFVRPAEYREWTFLASGLGMTYEPPASGAANAPRTFTNVFVNPSAHRAFMQSGKWPNGTALMLEIRA